MGYKSALEAAGATVLAYKSFGSYQGEWWAKVELTDHEEAPVVGWVQGNFGSCSVCDPFQAKMEGFDYRWDDQLMEYIDAPEEERQEALREFGKSYLNHFQTNDEAKAWAERILANKEDDEWWDDPKAAVFILENLA